MQTSGAKDAGAAQRASQRPGSCHAGSGCSEATLQASAVKSQLILTLEEQSLKLLLTLSAEPCEPSATGASRPIFSKLWPVRLA